MFKLLAIRPLENCHAKFLKNLDKGELYQFYQDYKFNFESDPRKSEITSVKVIALTPSNLYQLNNEDAETPKVSVSAIVGKNGSGKSSLTELLYAAVYILALEAKTLEQKDDKEIDALIKHLRTLIADNNETHDSLLDKNDNIPIKSLRPGDELQIGKIYKERVIAQIYLNERTKETEDKILYLQSILQERKSIRNQLHVEVLYQISGVVYKLKITPGNSNNCTICGVPEVSATELPNKKKETEEARDLLIYQFLDSSINLSEHFFYSIVLNYSQYCLNSEEIGIWIEELFHKNDGYQTPIVLNPMRNKGNVDINRENYLVRSRLLANLFSPMEPKGSQNPRELLKGKIAKKIIIELDEDKILKPSYPIDENKHWPSIEKICLFNKSDTRQPTAWDENARKYLLRKLVQIADKYPPYTPYKKLWELNDDKFEEYLTILMGDETHIAFKFHQVINFLKHDYSAIYFKATKPIPLEEIVEAMTDEGIINDIIRHTPPPFLKVDIYFSNENLEDSFNKLSSGEKQKIFTISSIVYHLRYLNSVEKREGLPYIYSNINLLFDEIELYHHPDFQRTFIFDLLNAIKNTPLSSIKNINCLFLTHSPFILSDIPVNNTLGMIEGSPDYLTFPQQTFGANIHDLLADKFYMEGGFMGEFAKTKINEVVEYLQTVITESEIKQIKSLENPNEDSTKKLSRLTLELEDLKKTSITTKEECEELISLVGEPILYSSIMELYSKAFPKNKNHFIEEQIRKLKD